MRVLKTLIPLLAFALICGPLRAVSPDLPPTLPDQFGGSDGLSNYPGQPLLVIVVDVRKLRWVGRWEETLRARLPDYTSIRVANVPANPTPEFSEVEAMLLKRAPPDISVLIDMDSSWAHSFDLDTREPCLLLLDEQHQVVARFRGRPKSQLVDEVLAELTAVFDGQATEPDMPGNT